VGQSRGCVARTPGGDEVLHSEDLGSKATGWVWQFAIFAVGTLPAVGMIVLVSRDPGGTDASSYPSTALRSAGITASST